MGSRWLSQNEVIDLTSDDDVIEIGSNKLQHLKPQTTHPTPSSHLSINQPIPVPSPSSKQRHVTNEKEVIRTDKPPSQRGTFLWQLSPRKRKATLVADPALFLQDTRDKADSPDRPLKQQREEAEHARRLEIRNKRRCTECIATGLECDGEKPCSRCCEPGFDCRYPGENGNGFTSSLILSGIQKRAVADFAKPFKPQTSAIEDYTSEESQISVQDLGSESSGKDVLMLSPLTPSFPSTKEANNDPASNLIYQNSWIPQTLNEVKELIKEHEHNLNIHREYLVQAEAFRSKISGQQSMRMSHPLWKENPWKKLVASKGSSDLTKQLKPHIIMFQIKTLRGSGPKRYNQIVVKADTLAIDSEVPILPKYRSIGRLGPSFLSKNVHTLKFMPYYADDEGPDPTESVNKEAELKDAYRTLDVEFFKQRRCLDVVFQWSDHFHDLLKELCLGVNELAKWLHQSSVSKCGACEMTFKESKAAHNIDHSIGLPQASALRCLWLYQAFRDIVNIGIWHFLEPKPGTIQPGSRAQHVNAPSEGICSICSVYNCLSHGAFEEGDENDESNALINDAEDENNKRQMLVTRARLENDHHICGLYCIPELFSGRVGPDQIYGVDDTGIFKGIKNDRVAMIHEARPFPGTASCSPQCFLHLQTRGKYMGSLTKLDLVQPTMVEQRICKLAKVYDKHVRLPCILARILGNGTSCMKAFEVLLSVHHMVPHVEPSMEAGDTQELQQGRKLSRLVAGYDTSRSAIIDKRRPFVPCSHTGPCIGNGECPCAHEKVHCEWSCACAGDCKRRFKGCRCKGPCFNDDRCECWRNSRECDPWLCGNCGVVDVLDPSNKYREEIREGRCRNNRIQLGLPARTIKARSEVQGWGLFAGEDLDAFTFIGEYKGEIVQNKEASRRGVVYHYNAQEYLFMINTSQEIDGSNFGNKTRFMNNSQRDENINVLAKTLLCNGIQRVMFYTKRSVKAGEELLYNYNYPEWVHKAFWEKGEKHVGKNGVVTPLAKPRISGRFARTAIGKHDGEETPARKHDQDVLRKKRKRIVDDEDDEDEQEDENRDVAMEKVLGKLRVGNPVRSGEQDGSDSEYEIEGEDDDEEEEHVSSLSDEMVSEESGSEEVFKDNPEKVTKNRRRRVLPGDGRRGGDAQRKAWVTRKAGGTTGKFTRR
ncbi:hypothetical protein H2198_005609 [Neophaeococcomyces mojaviensis]|uniref:Uncharacterized protein n=1 Tax=Neophaeococcomyces mojaviensis TaxID=3383035 RepID=A0ACC3A5M1_9EURO|nr:hypothetical protein H2198_005609 [Knufia sp. JES_112]